MSKKITYEYVKEYIESFGYKLLSKQYANNQTKLKIQCPQNHIFEMSYNHFQSGNRCPECKSNKALDFNDVKIFIESSNYKLISTFYKNARTKLEVECDKGHDSYSVTFDSFKHGHRCPKCANEVKKQNSLLKYGDVKNYIEIFGYTLLSDSYNGNNKNLKLQCPKGHEFYMTYSNFQKGNRCPECTKLIISEKLRLDIKDVKDFIEQQRYTLISDLYINNSSKIILKCPKNHIFNMSFANFKNGQRCPTCSFNNNARKRALSYEYVKDQIESIDGYKLLSTKYINANTKLILQCSDGHVFEKSYNKFKQGQRCPICAESKGEAKSRQYFESLNINFKSQYTFDDCRNIEPLRFDFAIFDDNNNLQFLYEYDGEFHYHPIEGQKKFKYQQKLDKIKNTYCKQNNIPLLRIPYWDFDNITTILNQELNKYNIKQ